MAWRGHRGLDTTNTKHLNVTRATRASTAPACSARPYSLRTSARQSCACVFLVIRYKTPKRFAKSNQTHADLPTHPHFAGVTRIL